MPHHHHHHRQQHKDSKNASVLSPSVRIARSTLSSSSSSSSSLSSPSHRSRHSPAHRRASPSHRTSPKSAKKLKTVAQLAAHASSSAVSATSPSKSHHHHHKHSHKESPAAPPQSPAKHRKPQEPSETKKHDKTQKKKKTQKDKNQNQNDDDTLAMDLSSDSEQSEVDPVEPAIVSPTSTSKQSRKQPSHAPQAQAVSSASSIGLFQKPPAIRTFPTAATSSTSASTSTSTGEEEASAVGDESGDPTSIESLSANVADSVIDLLVTQFAREHSCITDLVRQILPPSSAQHPALDMSYLAPLFLDAVSSSRSSVAHSPAAHVALPAASSLAATHIPPEVHNSAAAAAAAAAAEGASLVNTLRDRVILAKRTLSPAELEKKYGDNLFVIDVSQRGELPWKKFHPSYAHHKRKIPVPSENKRHSFTVKAILEGAKVFTREGPRKDMYHSDKAILPNRTTTPDDAENKFLGWQLATSDKILSSEEAYSKIVLPCYISLLFDQLRKPISRLREALEDGKTVIILSTTSSDSKWEHASLKTGLFRLNHAALLRRFLVGESFFDPLYPHQSAEDIASQ